MDIPRKLPLQRAQRGSAWPSYTRAWLGSWWQMPLVKNRNTDKVNVPPDGSVLVNAAS